MGGYIPQQFTENDGDKLDLYQEIKAIRSLQQLYEYQHRIEDLFGKIPKEVSQLFKKKKLDLFVNEDYVDSLKETNMNVQIQMAPAYSKKSMAPRSFTI